MANNSKTAEEIEEQLQERFNKQIDVMEITTVTVVEEQQLKLMEALTTNLRDIADQKKEIQGPREDILQRLFYTPNKDSAVKKKGGDNKWQRNYL